MDEERQRLVEQLAEAQQKLEEKERGEGEDQRKLQALVDESERTIRRQRETIEEVRDTPRATSYYVTHGDSLCTYLVSVNHSQVCVWSTWCLSTQFSPQLFVFPFSLSQ